MGSEIVLLLNVFPLAICAVYRLPTPQDACLSVLLEKYFVFVVEEVSV